MEQELTIEKRDGSTQVFDSIRVYKAISNAVKESQVNMNPEEVEKLVTKVVKLLFETGRTCFNIEFVQDQVEKVLMSDKLYDVAKHYILYRQSRKERRDLHGFDIKNKDSIQVPFGEIGYITYKRTYSRKKTKGDKDTKEEETEEFEDTILRILKACQTQLKVGFTNKELEDAYRFFMNLKGSVAGRFLWQLGTSTVEKLGLMSLQNCAFTSIDRPIDPFLWVFDSLMLGTGVGVSIEKQYVSKLPAILDDHITVTRQDTNDADFIIPDSREGWGKFLNEVLRAFYETGNSFTYSTVLIRSAGTPIRGFGGVASGPESLCKGIAQIVEILSRARGRQLKPIECMDIVDIIGSIVVAGNVRRSAIIIIGDPDDKEYLSAKRWDLGNIPNWRAMSNNSVNCSDISVLPEEFWEGYRGNGEPYGLVNMDLCRNVGRLKDGGKYKDPEVKGFNPCGEICLPNYSTCCLSEIFLPNIDSYEELKKVATTLYRICKHSLMLHCHQKETEYIVHKEMRIGVGISGYLQCSEEQRGWLSDLYEYLREYDIRYSEKHNVPISIKLTTVKPSGTLSLIPGITPGSHPAIFKYFIRRIRMASNNKLVDLCKSRGYHVEYLKNFDGTEDHKTVVVEFPCRFPDKAVLAKDMTAIDELEVVKKLQTEWSDNSVSCTIYYRLEELDEIRKWLAENYTTCVKSVSFLLHHDSGFKQMPYEEITEEKYYELKSKSTPINNCKEIVDDELDSFECKSGFCPIK